MGPRPGPADPPYRKSSHSQPNQGECLEVADLRGAHAVRDTRDPATGPLVFGSAEWHAALAVVRAGSSARGGASG